MNVAVIIGTTHQISAHYPASQAQLVPSQLDPSKFKIPARGRNGTFGFTCVDFKSNDKVRQFNGYRTVVFLTTSRAGVVYWTDVFYDWDAVLSITTPEGDPVSTLTAEDRTFRYAYGYPGGGSGSASSAPYSTPTPFAGAETSVALAVFDEVNDGFLIPDNADLPAPAGYTPTIVAGSAYNIPGGQLYWGTASGITPTT